MSGLYENKASTDSDVMTTAHIDRLIAKVNSPEYWATTVTAPHILSLEALTTSTPIGSGWTDEEPCQAGYDHAYDNGDKRSRISANNGKRAKAKRKNRKAAKAARKARK